MVGSKPPSLGDNEETEAIRRHLTHVLENQRIAVPVAWLLQPEIYDTIDDKRADLGKLLFSPEFAMSNDKKKDLQLYCELSQEQIECIAEQMVGQWDNEIFRVYKRCRLTASNVGYVISAVGRQSYPPSLFGRLLNQSNLDGVSRLNL